MECEKLLDAVKKDFTKIVSKGDMFPAGSAIYAKQIRKGIFLIINVSKKIDNDPVHAMIGSFESIESIGVKEPIQLLFHLKINSNEDLYHLKTYLSLSI
ncbi:hypothetical protein ACFOWU_07105 [Epilithonimonas zeae]|uniref:Uncharacterized protein n=1 Tax=Epilithonimonas zeae TaxID=1416779 RepID=A0A1N6FUQ3_9FLAO|nr:hypothetical protein [Epilithonimonas zeae]SIN99015.1 hypothetical protein SAMN05444409_1490 [Epilithonimonas zeae]